MKTNFQETRSNDELFLRATAPIPSQTPRDKDKEKEESVEIYQKLCKITTSADKTCPFTKQKSRSSTEKDRIVVSEEEFYEINNIERENVGYLINDYFSMNFDKQTFLNKQQQMKENAAKFHHERRVRISDFYSKHSSINSKASARFLRSFSEKPAKLAHVSKTPDCFSKYCLAFIHTDLMVSSKQRKFLRSTAKPAVFDEEKALKKLLKLMTASKKRCFIDNHHYNKVISKPFKEQILKNCCKKAEFEGSQCHAIKCSLLTFYKFMEEVLKDHTYAKLLLFSYDFLLSRENLFLELAKLFFIPAPLQLTRHEAEKYDNYKTLPKQRKILAFIEFWLEARPQDFLRDKTLANFLRSFLSLLELLHAERFRRELRDLREKLAKVRKSSKPMDFSSFSKKNQRLVLNKNKNIQLCLEYLPSFLTHEAELFFAVDAETLAQQLCLIDHAMYSNTQPHLLAEFYKSPRDCAVLNQIIERYNFLTYFFILVIILQRDTQEKRRIIVKFLEIAEKSRKLQNFQCLLAMCNALSHFLVLRYRKIADFLPETARKSLQNIQDLICFNRNYEKLRRTIKESKPPFVPCLNIILRDLNQLDHENEWIFFKEKEFVNVKKLEKIQEIVENLAKAANTAYFFEKKPFFYHFFEHTFKDLLVLYVGSAKIEFIEDKLLEIAKSREKI